MNFEFNFWGYAFMFHEKKSKFDSPVYPEDFDEVCGRILENVDHVTASRGYDKWKGVCRKGFIKRE